MDFSFIEKAIVRYIQAHPEMVDKLVDALVKRLVEYLEAAITKA